MSGGKILDASPDAEPLTLAAWEDRTAALLEAGQIFLAQDWAERGLARFPGSHRLVVLRGLALIRTGAVTEAVATLRPLLSSFDSSPKRDAATALARAVAAVGRLADRAEPPEELLDSVVQLSQALEAVRSSSLGGEAVIDPATLLALGDLHLEAWQRTGDRTQLRVGGELLVEAFEKGGDGRAGVNAAVAARLLGEPDRAAALAQAAAAALAASVARMAEEGHASGPGTFDVRSALGVALLMLGEQEPALAEFTAACKALGRRSSKVVPVLRQVRRLQADGVKVPREVAALLKPPGVVVFTGHMLDRPGAEPARFPDWAEPALRAAIARRLEAMDVQIGYSGAACGAELLFVEAMLERDAEVNIVLPFARDDYVRACVAHGGPRWERRFNNALRLADHVSYATEEEFLGHEMLFRFQNQMLHGLATLRSQFLETAPYLLAVWDMQEGSLAGGAADFIDQWADIARLQIIDLDEVVSEAVASEAPPAAARPVPPPIPSLEPERALRCMLFADIVGYSKLGEGSIPAYMAFTEKLAAELKARAPAPEMINTWGDAIFAVMPRASDLVRFAFQLKDLVRGLGREFRGEAGPLNLNIRISLHAGPVFAGRDPFNDKPNFFGAHINRAARLEPVTVPGHIYATQQFVALLTTEESQSRHEAEDQDQEFHPAAIAEYVGVMSLAKNFGKQPVYHVRAAEPARELAEA
ncbi:MAG TPA: adenylate/guanylate cyclase domain-containing protein [Azospirillaceae bacterium]|nr:adenylate/guanylate cyclase domain-containing protein [Azospirillaceae bacterium]